MEIYLSIGVLSPETGGHSQADRGNEKGLGNRHSQSSQRLQPYQQVSTSVGQAWDQSDCYCTTSTPDEILSLANALTPGQRATLLSVAFNEASRLPLNRPSIADLYVHREE